MHPLVTTVCNIHARSVSEAKCSSKPEIKGAMTEVQPLLADVVALAGFAK